MKVPRGLCKFTIIYWSSAAEESAVGSELYQLGPDISPGHDCCSCEVLHVHFSSLFHLRISFVET